MTFKMALNRDLHSLVWLATTAAICGVILLVDGGGGPDNVAPPGQRPYCPVTDATRFFGPQPPSSQAAPPAADDEGKPPADIRKLTAKEINRIRYLELRGMRLPRDPQPDRVTVKVPKAAVDEFLTEMEGHPDFQGESARREFRKLTPPQKLHRIAAYKGADFADKVEIETDPEVFLEFRRNVLPTVFRGCATTGCHGPSAGEAPGFALFKDPKKSSGSIYANFIILNDLQVGNEKMINRSQPENSLLVTYMLPAKDVKTPYRHPGKADIKSLFQSRNAPDLKRIQQWIATLKHPSEDYGVHLVHKASTATSGPGVDNPKLP